MNDAIEKLGFQKLHCIKKYKNDTKLYYADVAFETPGCCLLEVPVEIGNDKKLSIQNRTAELISIYSNYSGRYARYYMPAFVSGPSDFQENAIIRMDRYANIFSGQLQEMTLGDIYEIGCFLTDSLSVLRHNAIIHGNITEDALMQDNSGNYVLGSFQYFFSDGHTVIPPDERFLPPEYFKSGCYTSDMDMYSIGMLLYRLLNNGNGPLEYVGQPENEAEESRRKGSEPAEPKYGNKALRKLIALSIHPDPKMRLSCNQLKTCITDIRKAISGETWLMSKADITPDDSHLVSYSNIVENVRNNVPALPFIPKAFEHENNASETGLSLDEHPQADTSDDKRSIWSRFSEKIEHNDKKKNQRKEIKREDNRKKKEATRAIRKDERDRRGIGRDDQKKIVLTLAVALVCIAGAIGFLFYLSKVNDSGIYNQIEYGNMSLSLKEIEKKKNSGRNVDDLVVSYIDKCLQEGEYRRIADGVRYFSDEFAITNREYMTSLIQNLVDLGKEKRAYDVLRSMESIGAQMAGLAKKLSDTYGVNG